ncbi:Uncharacterized protein Fot_48869 [Forsythia ovata]|uniref:Uncharacterized protein n=1 Tax=Forsythia ovata TaxID=205694 RepID=A0ABD1QA97_9LAMI
MDEKHKPQKFFGAKLDVTGLKKQSFGFNNVPLPGKEGSTKPNHCLCSPTTHRGSFRKNPRPSGPVLCSSVQSQVIFFELHDVIEWQCYCQPSYSTIYCEIRRINVQSKASKLDLVQLD